MVFFGGIAVAVIGKRILPQPVAKLVEEHPMGAFGLVFFCNVLSGNLLNSGAFEVEYNGTPIWSKIETGRFPDMLELKTQLLAVATKS